MDYVQRWFSNIKYAYNSMNPAILSGAIDVIVVEQPDGTLQCTPFYVRFGMSGVFNSTDKYVDIQINGKDVDLKMKLGENGLAYFHEPSASVKAKYSCAEVNDAEVVSALTKSYRLEMELLAGADENNVVAEDHQSPALRRSHSSSSSGFSSSGSEDEASVRRPECRSFRVPSPQLRQLQLRSGVNDARFSITTRLQGTTTSDCHIYLFSHNDKLVISDIDGTITKSDVLGHIIPAIGGQWAHDGVTELYSAITNNGFKIVYLSSRAIGQARQTKSYLQGVVQGSKTLPGGPVLISCTSLFMAFKKEVIDRNPQEFKIACLSDLKSLFASERPFFAGFGNRETDVQSYCAVGVPKERILIVNPAGEVRTATELGFHSTYLNMVRETVDYIFPPIRPSEPSKRPFDDVEVNQNKTGPDDTSLLTDKELDLYEQRRKEKQVENTRVTRKSRIRFFSI